MVILIAHPPRHESASPRMFVVMNMVLGKSELMNFSIEMIAPDMVFFVLAIYGYFKAK